MFVDGKDVAEMIGSKSQSKLMSLLTQIRVVMHKDIHIDLLDTIMKHGLMRVIDSRNNGLSRCF